jgi:hypothetical protein
MAELLQGTHPGLVPASLDHALRQRWTRGLRLARERANRVTTEGGRRAVLDGLANVFQDPHIALRHAGDSQEYRWPGFSVALSGDALWVASALPGTGVVAGDRLLSCDGRSAMAMVRSRLVGFRAFATDHASIVSAVPFLFVDEGNAFAGALPQRCRFQSGSGQRSVALNWSAAEFATMLPGLASAAMYQGSPAAQAGIRDGIVWISLPDLGPDAEAVVDAARDLLRSNQPPGPILVDLRTNTGGNSYWGDRLVEAIYGPDAVAIANQTAGLQATAKVWRASRTTLDLVRSRLSSLDTANQAAAGQIQFWRTLEAELLVALDRRAPFNVPITEVLATGSPRVAGVPPDHSTATRPAPQVFVLTDNFCSSSCLLLVSQLRALGAVTLGSVTTLSRRYSEAVSVALPSARSTLTTLVSMSAGGHWQIGPFVPDRQLPDTARTARDVENWALAEVRRALSN